jgi:hypothetical protein
MCKCPRYPAADGGEASEPLAVSGRLAFYGIEPLRARDGVVSNELINHLLDVEGI